MATFKHFLPMEKIQRQKKEKRKIMIKEMRAALPHYSMDEIKKIKMKFADVVQLEAVEEGFPSTANFIKGLINYQEDILTEYGRNTLMWYKNRLKESRVDLKFIKKSLTKAEDCHYKGDLEGECKEWIKLSSQFAFGENFKNWDWLTDQLFLQTVTVCSSLPNTRKYEAQSKYLYALFLVNVVKLTDFHFWEIESLLLSAKDLSSSQTWTTEKYLPTKQASNIQNECNYLLYFICIETAKRIYKLEPLRATNLSYQAKNYAISACYPEGKVEGLIIQGLTHFINRNANTAISCLHQAINLKLRTKNLEDRCIWQKLYDILDAFRNGNPQIGIKILFDFKQLIYVENVHIPYHVRNIFKYLGFFCLVKREPFSASRFLSLALYEIDLKEHFEDANEILAYIAMASALELFGEYTKVVRFALPDTKDLERLIQWKDARIKFWSKELKCSFSQIWNDIVLQREVHRLERKILFTVLTQEELEIFERTIGPLLQRRRTTAISIKRFASKTNLVLPIYKTDENEVENDNIDLSDLKIS